MGTYADLKARVADELNKKSLTTQIASAVSRAIEYYAVSRFAFNETEKTASTVANDEWVTYPAGLRLLDEIFVTVGGHEYKLIKKDYDDLVNMHGASTSIGQPLHFAERDGRFRIYPTPGQAYTLTVTGIYDETALSNDADSNGWTSGMFEDLVNQRAKYTIARDITYDKEVKDNAMEAIQEILNRIRKEEVPKTSSGGIKPAW